MFHHRAKYLSHTIVDESVTYPQTSIFFRVAKSICWSIIFTITDHLKNKLEQYTLQSESGICIFFIIMWPDGK